MSHAGRAEIIADWHAYAPCPIPAPFQRAADAPLSDSAIAPSNAWNACTHVDGDKVDLGVTVLACDVSVSIFEI